MTSDDTAGRTEPGTDAGTGAFEAVLDAVLVLAGGSRPATTEGPVDPRSLALGLRLALGHPDLAARLLAAIPGEAPVAPVAPVAPGAAAPGPLDAVAGELAGATHADDDPADGIAVVSQLLARSAALAFADDPELTREIRFGWAGRLSAPQVTSMGRHVQDRIAHGEPAELGRGFGIAWSRGVRIHGSDAANLFTEFTELQHAVCEVLAGRQLAYAEPAMAGGGIGSFLGGLVTGRRTSGREADQVLERADRPTQLGLVAAWNTWMAMRYRTVLPPELFERLVAAWVAAVGPLPDA